MSGAGWKSSARKTATRGPCGHWAPSWDARGTRGCGGRRADCSSWPCRLPAISPICGRWPLRFSACTTICVHFPGDHRAQEMRVLLAERLYAAWPAEFTAGVAVVRGAIDLRERLAAARVAAVRPVVAPPGDDRGVARSARLAADAADLGPTVISPPSATEGSIGGAMFRRASTNSPSRPKRPSRPASRLIALPATIAGGGMPGGSSSGSWAGTTWAWPCTTA